MKKDIKTTILIISSFVITTVVFSLGMILSYRYEETKKQAQKQAVEWSEFGSPYKVYQVAENEMMLYNAQDTIFVLFEQDLNSTEKIVFLTRKQNSDFRAIVLLFWEGEKQSTLPFLP